MNYCVKLSSKQLLVGKYTEWPNFLGNIYRVSYTFVVCYKFLFFLHFFIYKFNFICEMFWATSILKKRNLISSEENPKWHFKIAAILWFDHIVSKKVFKAFSEYLKTAKWKFAFNLKHLLITIINFYWQRFKLHTTQIFDS